MTLPEKYKFKVSVDQGGYPLCEKCQEKSEMVLIDIFEKVCLALKEENKDTYNMIELGSNQAFYSLSFKHILGKEKTFNIMIEPSPIAMKRGKDHFALNNCEGIFIPKLVGKKAYRIDGEFESTLISEVIEDHKLETIDILHCDIDLAEYDMLIDNENIFENKNVKYIFLCTHTIELHNTCKNFLIQKGYSCILEDTSFLVGGDSVLVFKL